MITSFARSAAGGNHLIDRNDSRLHEFVRQSNEIEGIIRLPTGREIDAHYAFLTLDQPFVQDMVDFVTAILDPAFVNSPLRSREGMDVRVGNHLPPRGGPKIPFMLHQILDMAQGEAVSPYTVHAEYETLHPFMDGNGRSGRLLWAWQMLRHKKDPFALPFLHRWYYDSLNNYRR